MKKPIENKLLKNDRTYIERDSESTAWITNGHWAVKINIGDLSVERQQVFKSIAVGDAFDLNYGTKQENALMDSVMPKGEGVELRATRALFSDPWNNKVTCRKMNGSDVTTYVNEDYRRLIETILGSFDSIDALTALSPITYRKNGKPVALIMPMREDGSE